MRFRNRSEAGRSLAQALERYKDRPDVLVLALPRGGRQRLLCSRADGLRSTVQSKTDVA